MHLFKKTVVTVKRSIFIWPNPELRDLVMANQVAKMSTKNAVLFIDSRKIQTITAIAIDEIGRRADAHFLEIGRVERVFLEFVIETKRIVFFFLEEIPDVAHLDNVGRKAVFGDNAGGKGDGTVRNESRDDIFKDVNDVREKPESSLGRSWVSSRALDGRLFSRADAKLFPHLQIRWPHVRCYAMHFEANRFDFLHSLDDKRLERLSIHRISGEEICNGLLPPRSQPTQQKHQSVCSVLARIVKCVSQSQVVRNVILMARLNRHFVNGQSTVLVDCCERSYFKFKDFKHLMQNAGEKFQSLQSSRQSPVTRKRYVLPKNCVVSIDTASELEPQTLFYGFVRPSGTTLLVACEF